MEDYLQHMKTLRSQMNEVEDQAAKISVEEQMHMTTIQNLEKDMEFVKNETKRLKEETDRIVKDKGQICSRILENQRKVTSLESDSSTLNQTLDLIRSERVKMSAKLIENSMYHSKIIQEITKQLNDHQGWIIANKNRSHIGEKGSATQLEHKIGNKTDEIEAGSSAVSQCNRMKNLMMKLDASTNDFDRISHLTAELVLQNSKMRQLVELVNQKLNNFKPELKQMDSKMLKEELQALLSDKAGETGYLQSLQLQTVKIMKISHTVKCSCGKEYTVDLGLCA